MQAACRSKSARAISKVIVASLTAAMLCSCQGISAPEENISGTGTGVQTPTRNINEGAGLLSGFFFKFTRDDHPLQVISAHPLPGNTIEVAFNDRDPTSADDEYIYTLLYRHLNDPGIISKSVTLPVCITHCPLFDQQLRDGELSGQFAFVLRGFKFTYARNDFAIKKFALVESQGTIDVELHDRGGLNQFAVTVDYALVPKTLISSPNPVEIELDGSGAQQRLVPPGNAVLAGFSFEYRDDDFRMFELGALARQPVNPGPNVQVFFNDRSQSRFIITRVRYNVLNVPN